MPSNQLHATLSSLTLGPELTFENLTMIPLLRIRADGASAFAPESASADKSAGQAPSYSVLDDALAAGVFEITEISEHGSVPELRAINRGPDPVLIVDGEELLGAKQNRVVNLTILVAAHSELTIPVSCVEAGRWRARSKTFAAAPRAQYAAGRARRMSQVTGCMRELGGRYADQADVWLGIAEKSARLGSSSPTSAMEALFLDHAAKLDDFVRVLRPVDGQVGALFGVSGRIVGVDVFDRPATLGRALPKLVRSVAIDAIDAGTQGGAAVAGPAFAAAAAHFLAALSSAPVHTAPAVGLGEDVRLSAPGLTGAALALDGAIIHLSGFAV